MEVRSGEKIGNIVCQRDREHSQVCLQALPLTTGSPKGAAMFEDIFESLVRVHPFRHWVRTPLQLRPSISSVALVVACGGMSYEREGRGGVLRLLGLLRLR